MVRKKGVTNKRPRFRKVEAPSKRGVFVKTLVPWCDKDHLAVGHVIEHPLHGLVYITEGAVWVDGRLSNHWSWRRVRRGVLTGKPFSGYGYEFDIDYLDAKRTGQLDKYFDGNHKAQD